MGNKKYCPFSVSRSYSTQERIDAPKMLHKIVEMFRFCTKHAAIKKIAASGCSFSTPGRIALKDSQNRWKCLFGKQNARQIWNISRNAKQSGREQEFFFLILTLPYTTWPARVNIHKDFVPTLRKIGDTTGYNTCSLAIVWWKHF